MYFVIAALVCLSVAARRHYSSFVHFGGVDENDDLFERPEPPRTSSHAAFDLDCDLSGSFTYLHVTALIWQECLEVTVGSNEDGGPLHHSVADGNYISIDDTETAATDQGAKFSWKTIIASPTTKEESYGATAVVVNFVEPGMPIYEDDGTTVSTYDYHAELAVRFIDSDGNLRFQQNLTGGIPFLTMTRQPEAGTLGCQHPFTKPRSAYCSAKTYTDEWNRFSPACCQSPPQKKGYFNGQPGQADPKWKDYVSC